MKVPCPFIQSPFIHPAKVFKGEKQIINSRAAPKTFIFIASFFYDIFIIFLAVPERKLGFFVKIKEDENFNHSNTGSISRIKI
jgi:hypothetical protein